MEKKEQKYSDDEILDLIQANTMLEGLVMTLKAENGALASKVLTLQAAQTSERNLSQGNPTGYYLLCAVHHKGQIVTSADLTDELVTDLQAIGCTLLQKL
jgi:hypothetical protein